ncbi:MAG: SemiSWEET family transporter [Sediminibacterium sp.]|nr:SemiSWEET family transporter [Sediminibacterium sp.]
MTSELTIELFGFVGTFLTCVTLIPQVIQTFKTKKVKDLNLWMLIIMNMSTIFWFIYGVLDTSRPVILANFIVFCLSVTLIFLKIKYKNK